jgi:hypothetical protein
VPNIEDYNTNNYISGPSDPFGRFSIDDERMSLYLTYKPTGAQALGNARVDRPADEFAAERKRVNKYDLPGPGNISKLSIYLAPTGMSGEQVLKGVIYADEGGKPGALLGATEQLTFKGGEHAGWFDLTLPLCSETAGRQLLDRRDDRADYPCRRFPLRQRARIARLQQQSLRLRAEQVVWIVHDRQRADVAVCDVYRRLTRQMGLCQLRHYQGSNSASWFPIHANPRCAIC